MLFALAIMPLAFASPVRAQSALVEGFAGALRGCEAWLLNPETWTDGLERFHSTVGLGRTMFLVEAIDESQLPPEQLRKGNLYWRINSTKTAGYVLVVSDELPMCHITGGGAVDLQPVVESVLATSEFQSRWELDETDSRGEMVTSVFRNRGFPHLIILISRAVGAGLRLDRIQLLATAVYE